MTYPPERVIPAELAAIVQPLSYWFVIGGHAVRCLRPYRPSRDVDFGVPATAELEDLLAVLEQRGRVEVLERAIDTVHLRWDDINVSIFVLENLVPFVEGRRLGVQGILATKVHAILDRGLRRDFFDLYVTLQDQQLGISECLHALRTVYQKPVSDALLLRALTYFDDAEREAPLPGEGQHDWSTVTSFFQTRVASLLVPPAKVLEIQRCVVDLREK